MSQNDENWDKLMSFDGELITYKKVVIFMKELINDYEEKKMKEFIEACDKEKMQKFIEAYNEKKMQKFIEACDKEKMQKFIEACDRVWKEIIEANKEEILEKVKVCKKERQDFFDHVFNYSGGPYGFNPIVYYNVRKYTGISKQILNSSNWEYDLEDFLSYVKVRICKNTYDFRYKVRYNDNDERIPYSQYLFGRKNLDTIWKDYVKYMKWKDYVKYMKKSPSFNLIPIDLRGSEVENEDEKIFGTKNAYVQNHSNIFDTIKAHVQHRSQDSGYYDSYIKKLKDRLKANISQKDLFDSDTGGKDITSEIDHNKAVIRGLSYIKRKINGRKFPIDEEIMMCIQFFDDTTEHLSDLSLKGQPSGLKLLNQTAIDQIRRKHNDNENQELSPENRLRKYLKDSEKRFTDNTDYRPSNEKWNSKNAKNRQNKWNKQDFWLYFCPIHDPQALADLLAIDYKECTKYVQNYLNFIVRLIWPDKWKNITWKPTDKF